MQRQPPRDHRTATLFPYTPLSRAGAQCDAGLASVVVDNSGTITGVTAGLAHGTAVTLSLTNSGTIAGDVTGVVSDAGGAVTLVNSGDRKSTRLNSSY